MMDDNIDPQSHALLPGRQSYATVRKMLALASRIHLPRTNPVSTFSHYVIKYISIPASIHSDFNYELAYLIKISLP